MNLRDGSNSVKCHRTFCEPMRLPNKRNSCTDSSKQNNGTRPIYGVLNALLRLHKKAPFSWDDACKVNHPSTKSSLALYLFRHLSRMLSLSLAEFFARLTSLSLYVIHRRFTGRTNLNYLLFSVCVYHITYILRLLLFVYETER